MSSASWLQNFRSALAPRESHRGRRASHRDAAHRPNLEILEDRSVPAFLAPVDYAVGDGPHDVEAGDFNNDGRLDLVTSNFSIFHPSTYSVLLGDGDGTFQPARNSVWPDPMSPDPVSLVVGDFDQDGKLDLVGVSSFLNSSYLGPWGSVSILLGRGDATFEPPVKVPLGVGYGSSFATGDLNADGMLDLVERAQDYDSGDPYVGVLLGHGDGSFGPDTMWYGPYPGSYPWLALGDFDGNGTADVALSGASGKVFLSNGDGTLQEPRDVGTTGGYSLTAADFDADGELDLATTYSVLRGNGDGTFQPAQPFTTGADPYSISAADVSGDGVLDLVMTNRDAVGGLTVLLGTGDGSFGPPITTAAGSHPNSLVVADLNADGRPDAVTAHTASDRVAVLLNDGVWDGLPPPPSITVNDGTVTEGNTGTVSATFTVTLSQASSADVTVHYDTADGTAAAGSDYTAKSGTVVIPAGQTSATITVAVRGDRLGEVDETFVVNLSGATNATIADGQGIGTIVDNEPRISISDFSKKEGNGKKTTAFTFTVTLSVAYDQPVTMSFQAVNGTATTGDNDYVAKAGTLTFAPGETTKTITIEVRCDSRRESDESFYLDLSGNSSNSLLTKKRGIGTILNDD